MAKVILFFLLIAAGFGADAQSKDVPQTQLVLLNHQKVLARYRPGSVITYKLKHHTEFMTSLILEVREFSIVTSFDTIPFEKIVRVNLKGQPHGNFATLMGTFFFAAGLGYFAVDQINSMVVHGDGYDNDPQVWGPALGLVGGGFLLKQAYKRTQRVRYPAKLLAAKKGSIFYLPVN
jgi:hypothetical protein